MKWSKCLILILLVAPIIFLSSLKAEMLEGNNYLDLTINNTSQYFDLKSVTLTLNEEGTSHWITVTSFPEAIFDVPVSTSVIKTIGFWVPWDTYGNETGKITINVNTLSGDVYSVVLEFRTTYIFCDIFDEIYDVGECIIPEHLHHIYGSPDWTASRDHYAWQISFPTCVAVTGDGPAPESSEPVQSEHEDHVLAGPGRLGGTGGLGPAWPAGTLRPHRPRHQRKGEE